MERAELFKLIAQTIADRFSFPIERVTDSTSALDVPGWDSFAHGLLIMDLEVRIGRPLPLDRTLEARNVAELIDVVRTAR